MALGHISSDTTEADIPVTLIDVSDKGLSFLKRINVNIMGLSPQRISIVNATAPYIINHLLFL